MQQENLNLSVLEIMELNREKFKNIKNIELCRETVRSLLNELKEQHGEKTVLNLVNLISELVFYQKDGMQNLLDILQDRVVRDKAITQIESEDNFDDRFGTQTGFIREQFDLDETISIDRFVNSQRYCPTPVKTMLFALDILGVDYSEYTFIDIGSGMGRNLLIASEYSFNNIIGVEISKYLHEIAENNINIYQSSSQKCKNIRSYCMNVLDYDIPNEKGLILYFWEPFPEHVFKQFFQKLEKLINAGKNKLFLIFLGENYSTIEESKTLNLFYKSRNEEFGTGLFIYSN